ncbi:MAG: homoserine kinase [Dehalococcoidia bacterium]
MALGTVSVRVPATAANLGPAFDCMGLALNLYTTVSLARSAEFALDIRGYGADQLSRGADNLVYRSVCSVYKRLGERPPALRLRCRNTIPIYRGLGSSAAAVVGGLVAANALEGRRLSQAELLDMALRIEGHPDNVAPALLGGCQIALAENGKVTTSGVPIRRGLRGVIFVPDVEVPTKEARRLLSPTIARGDAVFNVGRAALLVLALSQGRWDLLPVATQDRLHQAPRRTLFPAMDALFQAAREAGADGVFLSGAGPTVLAMTTGDPTPVGKAMAEAAGHRGIGGFWKRVALGGRGAHVVKGSESTWR